MNLTVSFILVVVGVIHLLPLAGVLGVERLNALYGIELADPNLILLMQHRAVLFGLLGAWMVASVIKPELHWPALLGGLISVLTFILFSRAVPNLSDEIARVVFIDWIAFGLLMFAAAMKLFRDFVA